MAESLLSGVQDDLDNIIYNFSLLRSFDFNDFTNTWNEMKFYYIYCGRPTELEMKFFTLHVLTFAKNMILPNAAGEYERAGALYLLHCLYYSQPLAKPVEIRANLEHIKELMEFVESVSFRSYDPTYALTKLLFDNAFHFVYCDIPKTIEKAGKVDLIALSLIDQEGEIKEQRHGVMDIIHKAKLDEKEWHSVENDYNGIMQNLSTMNIGPHKLEHTPSDFFKDLFFPEKPSTSGTQVKENNQEFKPILNTGVKRRKQRLLKMMVEGMLTKEEDGEEQIYDNSLSLPILDDPEMEC